MLTSLNEVYLSGTNFPPGKNNTERGLSQNHSHRVDKKSLPVTVAVHSNVTRSTLLSLSIHTSLRAHKNQQLPAGQGWGSAQKM